MNSSTPFPKTCKMLEAWDIDYNKVCVDGFSYEGYLTFAYNDEGNRIITAEGRPLRYFNEWPDSEYCDVELIIEQFIAEGGTVIVRA
jgi:hypothetical protein